MRVISLDPTIAPLIVVFAAALAVAAAVAPIIVGARDRHPAEAIAGGVLGLLSLCWLLLAFMTEAFCDGTCGRDAATLYISGSAGLAGCLLLAAALMTRRAPAVRWSAVFAGAVALGVGAAKW